MAGAWPASPSSSTVWRTVARNSSPKSAKRAGKNDPLRIEQLVELIRDPALHAGDRADQRQGEVIVPPRGRQTSSIVNSPSTAARAVVSPSLPGRAGPRPRSPAATRSVPAARRFVRPTSRRAGDRFPRPTPPAQGRPNARFRRRDAAAPCSRWPPTTTPAAMPERMPTHTKFRSPRSRRTRARPAPSSGCCFPGTPARRIARSAAGPSGTSFQPGMKS